MFQGRRNGGSVLSSGSHIKPDATKLEEISHTPSSHRSEGWDQLPPTEFVVADRPAQRTAAELPSPITEIVLVAVIARRQRRSLRCRPRPRRRAMPACFRLLSLPGGVVVQIMDCRTNVVPSWVLRTSVVLQSSMNASAANMYVRGRGRGRGASVSCWDAGQGTRLLGPLACFALWILLPRLARCVTRMRAELTALP